MDGQYVIVQMDKYTYKSTETDYTYPEEIARQTAKEMEQSRFFNPDKQYWFFVMRIV